MQSGDQFFEECLSHPVAYVTERTFHTLEQFGDKSAGNADSGAFRIYTGGISDDAVMPSGILVSCRKDLRTGQESFFRTEKCYDAMVLLTGKHLKVQTGNISQIRSISNDKTVNVRVGTNIFTDFLDNVSC